MNKRNGNLIYEQGEVSIADIEGLISTKDFLKNYTNRSLNMAIEEYRMDSAFNSFQPKFILSMYRKELRKFGVRASANPYFINSVRENEILEDALTMAADISALFVVRNDFLFSKNIVNEALAILDRHDQYVYEEYLLGFGYFLKSICFNGIYAIKTMNRWVQENIDELSRDIRFSIKDIQFTTDGQQSKNDHPLTREIKFSLCMKFPIASEERVVRINSMDFLIPSEAEGDHVNHLLGNVCPVDIPKLLERIKEE